MKRNEYFDNHPVYNQLPYHAVIGLIQLMIDEGLVSPDERNGFYMNAKDLRDTIRNLYYKLDSDQKQEYIAYFRYTHHLYHPFTYE